MYPLLDNLLPEEVYTQMQDHNNLQGMCCYFHAHEFAIHHNSKYDYQDQIEA